VIEKYPEHIYKSYANRGLAFTSIGKWDDAINDFNKVIELDPNYGWGYIDRGVAYQNTNQWDRSIGDFSKAIEIDPDNLDAYAGRGVSYGVLGQPDKAIADLSRTIKLNPKYTKGYSNRGVTYATLGYQDKAIADYSKAIELDPGFKDAYTNRSIAYGRLSQWDNAIADGINASKLDPENAGIYDRTGYYYLGKDDPDHAGEQFRKSINIDNKSFDALLGLALINYRKGDKDNAKNFLDQAKSIESRLNNGLDGINELEKLGYPKPDNIKEILKKMLKEFSG
jgi:tetratricopeptide (TPR) repeat protein